MEVSNKSIASKQPEEQVAGKVTQLTEKEEPKPSINLEECGIKFFFDSKVEKQKSYIHVRPEQRKVRYIEGG